MNYVVEQKISSKSHCHIRLQDFEYVRSMLVLGCVDYLLKPLNGPPCWRQLKKGSHTWKEDRRKTMTPGRCFIRSIT